MFSIRKINPMVRAVGTMGAVAALVGGITYAAISTPPVTLGPNTLTAASASLAIATSGCGGESPVTTTTAPGFNSVKLTPGVASDPVSFCLENNGDIPLTITAAIPTTTGGDIALNKVHLKLDCGGSAVLNGTLDQYAAPVAFPGPQLAASDSMTCTETATLDGSYTSADGTTVPTFSVSFVGNQ